MSHHFTAMSTAVLLATIVKVTSLLLHATNNSESSYKRHKLNLCTPLSLCYISETARIMCVHTV